MNRIRPDSRHSAILTFRFHRRSIGNRAAYWLAVYRYGWSGLVSHADMQGKRVAGNLWTLAKSRA